MQPMVTKCEMRIMMGMAHEYIPNEVNDFMSICWPELLFLLDACMMISLL